MKKFLGIIMISVATLAIITMVVLAAGWKDAIAIFAVSGAIAILLIKGLDLAGG